MPEISRFFGIVVRMFTEMGSTHHRPHIHLWYQDDTAVMAIETAELLGGSMPLRQRRLVEAWVEIHRAELLEDWELLQSGRRPFKIDPLC